MKKILMMGLLAGGLAGAQNGGGYIKQGPIGQSATSAETCPTGSRAALPITCWKNQRVIIIPKAASLQSFGYSDMSKYRSDKYEKVPHELVAGKTAIITNVEKDKYGVSNIIVLKIDGLPDLYQLSYIGDTVQDLAFIKDLDDAKKNLLGKTLWFKDRTLTTRNAAGDFKLTDVKRFSSAVVTDIQLSSGIEAQEFPVRVVLKTPEGKEGYEDIYWSKTNVHGSYGGSFEEKFFTKNPREIYKFPESAWKLIEQNKVEIGMSPDMVLLSLGEPASINSLKKNGISIDQWVYRGYRSKDSYYYFEGGRLTTIQN